MESEDDLIEKYIQEKMDFLNEGEQKIHLFMENYRKKVRILEKTLTEKPFNKTKFLDVLQEKGNIESKDDDSIKENESPPVNESNPTVPILLNKIKTEPVDVPVPKKRGRKPKIKDPDSIKSERTTLNSVSSNEEIVENPQNKEEKMEMLAPTTLPLRLQKIKVEPSTRSTRSKMKNSEAAKDSLASNRKDSDVILEDKPITTVEITDSDDETKSSQKNVEESTLKETEENTKAEETANGLKKSNLENPKESNADKKAQQSILDESKRKKSLETNNEIVETRSTRTKTRALQKAEENANAAKLNETYTNPKLNETYVAQKPTEKPLNETYVAEKVLDATVTVANPKFAPVEDPKDLMTDDESEEDVKTNKTKPVFSPYAKTTLKKKVEAFEKLNAFTKLAKEKVETPIRDKPKVYTPMSSKFLAKLGTSTKSTKTISYTKSSLSTASVKPDSTKKVSQTDYMEREKQRLEKEALKKKEFSASVEEKRKKREEKQLKAQQVRDALEKEKQKQTELLRLKEEKAKRLLQEQELKKQKLREEAEKKRLLAKQKYQEFKGGSTQSLQRVRTHVPIYLKQQAPMLPTPDCYDSDDEKHQKVFIRKPDWESSEAKKRAERTQLAAGDKIKNSLFCLEAQTPDLVDIFEAIDSRKLKRTSSAQWRNPPRYTMMPGWKTFLEEDESDEE